MGYKVVVTSDAENDLDQFIQYLLFKKKKSQLFCCTLYCIFQKLSCESINIKCKLEKSVNFFLESDC